MKRSTIYLFLGLMVCVLPINSQISINITPQAGLNLANITSTNGSFVPGLKLGVSGEYLFQPQSRWGVEMGLHYSMQGSSFRDKGLRPEHDYINIPLLAKFYLNNNYKEGEGLNFYAGPQFDILAMVNKVGFLQGIKGALLPEPMTKPFGLSAVAGAGYVFNSGFSVTANMNLGLTNKAKAPIWYDNVLYDRNNKSYKDIVFQVSFGYRFTLGRRWFSAYTAPTISDPYAGKPRIGSLGIEIEP
jgi:hypothetical protein